MLYAVLTEYFVHFLGCAMDVYKKKGDFGDFLLYVVVDKIYFFKEKIQRDIL